MRNIMEAIVATVLSHMLKNEGKYLELSDLIKYS